LPECEQELVGGYHTEYAGIKLLLFLVAEFLHMITASFLIVILFLGGWHFPGLGSGDEVSLLGGILRIGVLMAKIFLVIVFFMIVRWSWPRFRFDQLMALAWKVMLPLGMLNLIAVACLDQLQTTVLEPQMPGVNWDLALMLPAWLLFAVAWIVVAWCGPLVADNRPRLALDPAEVDRQI
jgi:NADH-quinone oxidoreductase subunit H